MEIVSVDIGGTNVRFAIATISAHGIELGDVISLETAQYATFKAAWDHFSALTSAPLPRAAAIAVACPVTGLTLKLTNSSWIIQPETLAHDLGLDTITLVNDFGAVGHAIAYLKPDDLRHIGGPEKSLPADGLISVIGPGTGLGVAQVLRRKGHAHVIETEGGHSDFAPLDAIEDAILAYLRTRYRRVSIERLVSGPGLLNIYEALGAIENTPLTFHDDKALWAAALGGRDAHASAALARFCMIFGAVAGDIALTQGAAAAAIAGGIGQRLEKILSTTGFASRFTAKGRFERMMASLPVKLITHPHVGLIGAAAAFAEEHKI